VSIVAKSCERASRLHCFQNDILSVSHGAAKTCTENILLEVSSVKKMDNYTVRKINLTSKDSKQV